MHSNDKLKISSKIISLEKSIKQKQFEKKYFEYFKEKIKLVNEFCKINHHTTALEHILNVVYHKFSVDYHKIHEEALNRSIELYTILGKYNKVYEIIKLKENFFKSIKKSNKLLTLDYANLHKSINNYDKAINLYLEAKKIKQIKKDEIVLNLNLTFSLIKVKRLDEALNLSQESLTDSIILKNKDFEDYSNYLKSLIFYEFEDYKKSFKLMEKVIINLKVRNKIYITNEAGLFLKILMKLNRFNECELYINVFNENIEKEPNTIKKYEYYKLLNNISESSNINSFNMKSYMDNFNVIIDEFKLIELKNINLQEKLSENKEITNKMSNLIDRITDATNFIGKIDNTLRFRDIFLEINNYLSKFINYEESTIIKINKDLINFDLHHFKVNRVYDRVRTLKELESTIFEKVLIAKKEQIISNVLEGIKLKDAFSNKYIDDYKINSIVAFPMYKNDDYGYDELVGIICFYGLKSNSIVKKENLSLLKIATNLFTNKVNYIEFVNSSNDYKEMYETTLLESNIGLVYSRDLSLFKLNENAIKIFNTIKNTINIETLLSFINREYQHKIKELLILNEPFNEEIVVKTKDNKWVNLNLIKNYKNKSFSYSVMLVKDISQDKVENSNLKEIAYYDELCQIFNRNKLTDNFKELKENSKKFTMMLLDLNKFKIVNDTYGHEAGDRVLQYVSEALDSTFTNEELGHTVYRQGGDEFVVLLNNCVDKRVILNKIKKLNEKLAKGFYFNLVTKLAVGCSIGIARYPTDFKDLSKMFKYADKAMYTSKISTDGLNYHIFNKEDLKKLQELDVIEQIKLF